MDVEQLIQSLSNHYTKIVKPLILSQDYNDARKQLEPLLKKVEEARGKVYLKKFGGEFVDSLRGLYHYLERNHEYLEVARERFEGLIEKRS